MLSTKLVHLIENHWEEIASRVIRALRSNPDTPTLAARSDLDLREWCREILENLGSRLAISREEDVRRRFQALGRSRFEESVPLHEAVLRLHILRDRIVSFIHEQGLPMSALNLYAEEELEQRITRFFEA